MARFRFAQDVGEAAEHEHLTGNEADLLSLVRGAFVIREFVEQRLLLQQIVALSSGHVAAGDFVVQPLLEGDLFAFAVVPTIQFD